MTGQTVLPYDSVPKFAPQDQSAIEWWFVQGQLEGLGFSRKHVMAALFLVHAPDRQNPPGAMLIQHVLDEADGRVWYDSRVTPETVACHNMIAERVARAGFPPLLRDVALWRHRQDMETWIRSAGVIIDCDTPEIRSEPFSLSWNGFALEEAIEGLSLRVMVGPGTTADVTLSPERGWLNARSELLHRGFAPAFAYQCCPRLTAKGRAGTTEVKGHFWIDRQWGRFEDWLLAPEGSGYRVLGWDWFGLNLNDERDLLVCRHRDAASGSTRLQYGVIFDRTAPRVTEAIEATPLSYWTSPRSAARYPVAWQLAFPELGLEGRVEPVIVDQEIPIYGTTAIWEGAAKFCGTQNGRDISGTGRLELVGYGGPLTVTEHLRRNLNRYAMNIAQSLGLAPAS